MPNTDIPAAPITKVTTPASLVDSSLTAVLRDDAKVFMSARPASASRSSLGTASTKAAKTEANSAKIR